MSRSIAQLSALALAAAILAHPAASPADAANAPDCPPGGTVNFGVEAFEAATRLLPAYDALAKLLAARLGCPVELCIPTNYNAEVEAMRSGKLDVGEFGPLGYVLAHRVAHADVIATFGDAKGRPITYFASIVTWPGSGIESVKAIAGHSFVFSDPASTSGHLFPANALGINGVNPDTGVRPLFAGSRTASFETLRNHKVDAGELSSVQIESATQAGEYKSSDLKTLWKWQPIPNDAIVVRSTLPEAFKHRFTRVLESLHFSDLPAESVKVFPAGGAMRNRREDRRRITLVGSKRSHHAIDRCCSAPARTDL